MWRWVVFLFLLCACAPSDVAGRHAATMRLCGWRLAPVDEAQLEPPSANHRCARALMRDLSVDERSFRGVGHALSGLLDAARALAVADLGREVPLGLEASLGEGTGESEVAALLYDWVTGSVERTVAGNDPSLWASYDPQTRVLTVHEGLEGLEGAAILVHEARHGDGEAHVPCRGDPERMCDEGVDGAYGAQLAYHRLVLARALEPLVVTAQEEAIADCLSRIE